MGWEELAVAFVFGWCFGWDAGRKALRKATAKFFQGLTGK